MKKKKSYADKGIERFKLLLDPFPQLAYCKLVLFIICTFFSQFITKKNKKERKHRKSCRLIYWVRTEQQRNKTGDENVYRNSYARAKALRKWTSWEIKCIKVSQFKLPEAKQTKNGVYLAKTDSSLNLIHHFLAIPPSSASPILQNRRRHNLAKWRQRSRLLLWCRFE